MRFSRFQLERDGPTNRPTNQPTDGQSLSKNCVSATKKLGQPSLTKLKSTVNLSTWRDHKKFDWLENGQNCRSRAAAQKGTKSRRTYGYFCLFICRPSVPSWPSQALNLPSHTWNLSSQACNLPFQALNLRWWLVTLLKANYPFDSQKLQKC